MIVLSKSSMCVKNLSQICMQCWVMSRIAKRQINTQIVAEIYPALRCHRPLHLNRTLLRNYSDKTGKQSKNSSFRISDIITKDRLILLGFGVLVTGGLVGYERNINESKKYKDLVKRLHTTVLAAQTSVNEGNYEEALVHYREARGLVDHVTMSSKLVQKKVVLNIVDQLGHLAYALNNWDEAEMFLRETEKVMLDCGIEKEDDVYIEVMLRLAKIDVINHREQEAMDRFMFCIENLERKISVQDVYSEPDTPAYERITLYGMVLTEYGTYTKELGLLDESEGAFSKALNICRSVLGPRHEQTSVLANDLATVYDEKGRYNKAIRLAEKAIRIATETAPENLATYKYNLGHILMHKGDMGRARKALREALKLAEENEDDETRKLAESSIMKLDIN